MAGINEAGEKREPRSVDSIIADMDENEARMEALKQEHDMLRREYDTATADRIPSIV